MMKTAPIHLPTAFLALGVALGVSGAGTGTALAFERGNLQTVQDNGRRGAPSFAAPLVPLTPSLREERSQNRARDAVRRGEILSLEQVAARVQSRYPGRLLDVRLDESRGSPVYHLKMLTRDGRVLRIAADARTAQILGVGGR